MTLVPRSVVESAGKLQVNDTNRRILAANNTELVIDGETTAPFCIDGHSVPTQAIVSPDVEVVMLGSDWLHAHRCVWDFANSRIHIDGRKVVALSRKGPLMCRRAYVCDGIKLAPKQQANVPIRSTLLSLRNIAGDCIVDSRQMQPGLYVVRTLLPASQHDLAVCA